MERSALSAGVIEELGALFMGALRAAGPALATADCAGVEEQVQALGRQVFGRVVEQALAERAATVPAQAPPCAGCGRRQRLIERRGCGTCRDWSGTLRCTGRTTRVRRVTTGRRPSMRRWAWGRGPSRRDWHE
ncbi:MAG: hypothetical protein NVSMB65_21540 [Chloroflexota bacterium]